MFVKFAINSYFAELRATLVFFSALILRRYLKDSQSQATTRPRYDGFLQEPSPNLKLIKSIVISELIHLRTSSIPLSLTKNRKAAR